VSDVQTESIAADYTPHPAPGSRARIGLIILATDFAAESEILAMAKTLGDDVALFVNRIPYKNPVTMASLKAMEGHIVAATELIVPPIDLDAVAFACTSGTAAIGPDKITALIQGVRPGAAFASPVTGTVLGLQALGARKIALVTPYPDDVNDMERDYLEENGLEVVRMASFGLTSDTEISEVPMTAIAEAVKNFDAPEADAVFLSCSAFRVIAGIEDMERRIGKPLVTSNQALFWQALRGAGYTDPVAGFGRLLTL